MRNALRDHLLFDNAHYKTRYQCFSTCSQTSTNQKARNIMVGKCLKLVLSLPFIAGVMMNSIIIILIIV